jgi:peptide-methionine (R)-S-oxide reductase
MFHVHFKPLTWLSVMALIGFLLPIAVHAQNPVDASPKPSSGTARDADDAGNKKPDSPAKENQKAKAEKDQEPEFVYKTDEEWKKILTKNQFAVTRLKMTEPAFSGKYATAHYRVGSFLCVCCGAELFKAQHKFDSGTGWPSFYLPASARALQTAIDDSALESRMEVMCRRCGAHLGHVFNDGPPPTGLRFCINSIAIAYKRPGAESPTKQGTSKTVPKQGTSKTASSSKTKAKSNPKAKSSAKPAPQPTDSADNSDRSDTASAPK